MSKKMKFAAALLTAAFLSPAALAGGDGQPCFWKGGGHETTRAVAETPLPDRATEIMGPPASAATPDGNAVVKLDENGRPVLPEAEAAEAPALGANQ